MTREWQPGDVAMVSAHWADRDSVRREVRAVRHDGGGWSRLDSGDHKLDREVLGVRPLVVIDPEDREQVERLCNAADDAFRLLRPLDYEFATEADDGDLLAEMQLALRSMVAPAKPDEPEGLGAVVADVDGLRWIKTNPGGVAKWIREDFGCRPTRGGGPYLCWSEITAVRVLSQGVTP